MFLKRWTFKEVSSKHAEVVEVEDSQAAAEDSLSDFDPFVLQSLCCLCDYFNYRISFSIFARITHHAWCCRSSDDDGASTGPRGSSFSGGRQEALSVSKLPSKSSGKAVKVYLFNDAVMVANNRLGRAHCRDFVPLSDVDVIDSHPHMNLFGLKFIIKVGRC